MEKNCHCQNIQQSAHPSARSSAVTRDASPSKSQSDSASNILERDEPRPNIPTPSTCSPILASGLQGSTKADFPSSAPAPGLQYAVDQVRCRVLQRHSVVKQTAENFHPPVELARLYIQSELYQVIITNRDLPLTHVATPRLLYSLTGGFVPDLSKRPAHKANAGSDRTVQRPSGCIYSCCLLLHLVSWLLSVSQVHGDRRKHGDNGKSIRPLPARPFSLGATCNWDNHRFHGCLLYGIIHLLFSPWKLPLLTSALGPTSRRMFRH